MERRTFLGTAAALLSPISVESATATEPQRLGSYDAPRSDITVKNAVFTGSFVPGTTETFSEIHQEVMQENSGLKPGYNLDLSISGADDAQNPLMTVYPDEDTFILRAEPDSVPISRIDKEFTQLLIESGIDPQPVFDATELSSLTAISELDTTPDALNLGEVAFLLRTADTEFEDVVYIPEMFPVVKTKRNSMTALVFPNMRVIINGATDPEETVRMFDDLNDTLIAEAHN